MTFDVIKKDPEMLLFPIIATVLSAVFSVAMLFPTIIAQLIESDGSGQVAWGPLQYVATFATYFGLAFIATFANVCVVYTTKIRLEGGDATFGQSINFAFSRFGRIFSWSLVSATVGLILSAIEHAAQNTKGAGRIVVMILRGLLATAWTVISLFVVPVMVYRDLGPFDALKESMETLKRTWGESLVRYYGMGIASFVFYLPGIAVYVGITFGMTAGLPPALGFVLYAVTTIYMVGVALVFSVAGSVYNTALYHFASNGTVPNGFSPETIRGAFAPSTR